MLAVQTVEAGEVHADEPVGPAARSGRIGETVVCSGRLQRAEALPNCLGCQRGNPEALHRFRASDQLVDVAEDQLALPSCIGRRHDPGDFVAAEDSSDDLELITSLFVDDQGPLARQQREQIPPPTTPGRIDFVGFGERDKVTDGPRHDVSVAVLEPLATPVGAQDLGNVSCNGGLLGEDRRGLA